MGASQSTPAAAQENADAEVYEDAEEGAPRTDLYRLVKGKGFEKESAGVDPNFFDVNEDATGNIPHSWSLEVGDVETEVTDNFSFDAAARRVTFVSTDGIWALRFGNSVAYQQFADAYREKLFENTFKVENDETNRAKIFGKDSFMTLGQESDHSREQWSASVDDPDEVRNDQLQTPLKQGREKDAILGVRLGAGSRSYMVQDKRIGVLRNLHGGVQDTGLSFETPKGSRTASRLGTPGSQDKDSPAKMLLMHGERHLNMVTPDQGSALHQMDIETGQTVAEWGFQKDGVDVAMRDLINETKGAQLDDRDTFLGVGTNRLVRWDQRVKEGAVQDAMSSPSVVGYAGGKDYARNTNFSCMATSGDGHVVVGSEDGKVRLYSSNTLTTAKTSIPGLGAPVTSVDVSYDAEWVLASTDKYLMVVKTGFQDKSGKETNGFKARMGQAAPAPRLLRLKAEDQAKTGVASLKGGKFTWITEAGRQERWIVASCGAFTVLFNFRRVKLAQGAHQSYGGITTVQDYHLIPRQEDVVDSTFMHDNYSSPASGSGDGGDAMVVFTKHRVWSMADEDTDEE